MCSLVAWKHRWTWTSGRELLLTIRWCCPYRQNISRFVFLKGCCPSLFETLMGHSLSRMSRGQTQMTILSCENCFLDTFGVNIYLIKPGSKVLPKWRITTQNQRVELCLIQAFWLLVFFYFFFMNVGRMARLCVYGLWIICVNGMFGMWFNMIFLRRNEKSDIIHNVNYNTKLYF